MMDSSNWKAKLSRAHPGTTSDRRYSGSRSSLTQDSRDELGGGGGGKVGAYHAVGRGMKDALEEMMMISDSDDPRNHQYEEPRNVMPDQGKSATLRRKQSLQAEEENLLPLVSGNNRGTTIIGAASSRLDMETDHQLLNLYGSLRRRESGGNVRSMGHGDGMNMMTRESDNGNKRGNKYGSIPSGPAQYRTRLYGHQEQNSPSDNDIDGDLSSNDDSDDDAGGGMVGNVNNGNSKDMLSTDRRNNSSGYKRVLQLYGNSSNGRSNSDKDRLSNNISSSNNNSHHHLDDSPNIIEAPPPYHQINVNDPSSNNSNERDSCGASVSGLTTSSAIYGQRLQSIGGGKSVGGGSGGNIFHQNIVPQNSTTGPLVPLPNHVHPSQLLEPSDAPPSLRASGLNSSSYSSHHGRHHSRLHNQSSSATSAIAAFAASRFSFNWNKNCSQERKPCIWRLLTIFLVFICILLLFLVGYKSASSPDEDGKQCIVVKDSQTGVGDDKSDPSTWDFGGDGDQDFNTGQSSSHINKAKSSSPSSSSSSSPSEASQITGGASDMYSGRKLGPSQCSAINLPQEMSLFSEIKFRSDSAILSSSLKPHQAWTGRIDSNDPSFIRFLFQSIPVWSRMAMFARRSEPPTLTRYDLIEIISPHKSNTPSAASSIFSSSPRYRRASPNSSPGSEHLLSVEILDYFEPGQWFLMIVNDGQDNIPFHLNISRAKDIPTTCPSNCNGHGECSKGKCICSPGFMGQDCSESICPVFCSGHGRYLSGRCHCEIGWKGFECNIRSSDCEIADCSGHGRCVTGQCLCSPGYKGDNCETTDCLDPDCGGHGACIDGQCMCKMGWRGVNCTLIDQRLSKYFPHCNNRGVYDLDTEKCSCFTGWLGDDCSVAKCDIDCGPHGVCEGGKCACDSGWEGDRCERLPCDSRCMEHGSCSNGTCVCVEGWMGKYCTFNGCPQSCSNHGSCRKDSDMDGTILWRCACREGWTGKDCSFPMETSCADKIDNDHDGLTDCQDSECCSTDACKDSLTCLQSPDPLDILLRKSPSPVTASFYQKMKFLIEEGSVQSYAIRDGFSESRVSVIRGQVISPDGNGITGIRVSVASVDTKLGFTLTRPDGWFDILVNGGSIVTLQFQRSPFHPIKRTVMVPWNEIMVIQNPIVMSATFNTDSGGSSDGHSSSLPTFTDITHQMSTQWISSSMINISSSPSLSSTGHHLKSQCWDHDYSLMKPILFQTLRPDAEGGCSEKSSIIAESQVLLETLAIPGSDMQLVYQSSSAPGYLSAIHLQLTPSSIPGTLKIVHLRIVLEGNLFSKIFDAESDIKYSFSWNKRNVYRQKVYGLTNTRVYVGYQYESCTQIIWSTLTTQVRGFDMEISELASWNLNIHHRYNFHEGILQKGDGSAIFFKQQSRVVDTLIGNGEPRSMICEARDCDGLAKNSRLLAPITLTHGSDGSVYVGDGNLIRRIKPDGYTFTVFKYWNKGPNGGNGGSVGSRSHHHQQSNSGSSSSSSGSNGSSGPITYNYHIHFSAFDGHLYVADPERHQILRIHTVDAESSYDVFAGTGARCLPRDPSNCGDGGSAMDANLVFPKGMVFGLDGSLYFADGSAIRMVDWKGIIHTILSDNHHSSHHHRSGRKQWKPIPCDGSLPADQVKLRWPTEVTIHPVDGSLHFLDEQMIFRLTPDRRVMIVVGKPSYCDGGDHYHDSSSSNPSNHHHPNHHHSNHETLERNRLNGGNSNGPKTNRQTRSHSTHHHVGSVVTFAFTSSGDLFVTLMGKDGRYTINMVTHEGNMVHYMGLASQSTFLTGKLRAMSNGLMDTFGSSFMENPLECEIEKCKDVGAHNCTCALVDGPSSFGIKNSRIQLARDTSLLSPTSITITSDGVLHVADEKTFRIISAVPYIPGPDDSLQFTIASPETDELYVFNKYGQHIATRNAITGQTLHSFLYDVSTSFGKLSAISDASGNKVSFFRDSVNALYSIETANVQKCRVSVSSGGLLETFTDPDNLSTRFTYDPSTGLIQSRTDSAGFSYHYQYSHSGRLIGVVKPTGVRTTISFDYDHSGSSLRTRRYVQSYDPYDGSSNLMVRVHKDSASIRHDGDVFQVNLHEDRSIDILAPWREGMLWQSTVHKVILQTVPIQAGMFPILAQQINFILSNSAKQQSSSHRSSKKFQSPLSNIASISWDYEIKYTDGRSSSSSSGGNRNGFPEGINIPSIDSSASISTGILPSSVAAIERILYINNTRYLSLEYDRHANREILYNNSRRPFLMIQYDNSSRPITWMLMETRLPLNMIFDRFGRLAGWQQGLVVSETFLYDRSGLLSEIRYPDATSIKYTYDESGGRTKPSRITLRSGKQYKYQYDERSGLKRIITPRRTEHHVSLIISLGFYKLMYQPPGHQRGSHYILYMNDNLQPMMEIFPESQSKVVYLYDEHSKLTEIVYGGGKIQRFFGKHDSVGNNRQRNNKTPPLQQQSTENGHNLDQEDHLLRSEIWQEGSNEVSMQYQYHNSLIVKTSIKITAKLSRLSNFEFIYDYDEFGRKRSIGAKIISSSALPSITLPSTPFNYNTKTGKLESFGQFRVHDSHDYQHHQNESIITDGVATLSKVFESATHRLRQMSLSIKDKEFYRMDLLYNANGAIVTSKTYMRHLGSNKLRVSNYTYDSDEQLVEVFGPELWRYGYDENGNLAALQYQKRRIEISYDSADRVASYAEMTYTVDGRGNVIRRGDEKLYYNAHGMLMRVSKVGKHDVRYMYDSRGRLCVRHDSTNNITQYFYGDIERPHLVTHMFNNVDRTVTSLIYDGSGLPVMIQINHKTYYIACDQVGTPLLVLDHRGDVVKEIHRAPTGQLMYDSNSAFYLPIGFHGGILDPKTEIVHFGGTHIYDSTIGQWLTPNWAQVLRNLEEPAFLNLYRFSKNDPINYFPGESRSAKLDLHRWIQYQGIDLTGLDIGGQRMVNKGDRVHDMSLSRVPSNTWGYNHFSTFDALYDVPNQIAASLSVPSLPLLSAFWCSLQKNTRNFEVSSFIKKSKVKSEELLDDRKLTKISTENQPFGHGITVSSIESRALVSSAPDADPIRRDVFTKVFNNSFILDLNYVLKGLDSFYFVKPDLWRVGEDHSQLQRLGNAINVTTHEIKDDSGNKANHKGHQVDLRVHTRGALLNIRYGTTLEKERARVLRHVRKHTIAERWSREAAQIKNNNDNRHFHGDSSYYFNHQWNETEKRILLTTGSIPGYHAEYYHPVDRYPQLADDPNNIIFTIQHDRG
ncbi:teneurin-m-like isoform X2 [Brevipalpus obovatus]|uniref:teneurin-m-like isoform X2 n=1 Tax=Brevipalpus obovatus TaxID=246614 RepID=UPI003D9DCD43